MDDQIDAWLALETQVRDAQNAHGQPAQGGLTDPKQLHGLSGLQLLEAMVRGEVPQPQIAYTAHFFLVEVAAGHAVFQGTPQAEFFNPLGSVHGGWYAILLDSALGCAVHSTLALGERYATMEIKLNMVRPLGIDVPRVRAIGRLRHRGRQMATAEADLVGPDGKLYAHGSTTCLVFPAR